MPAQPPRSTPLAILCVGALIVLGSIASSHGSTKKKEKPAPAIERPAIPQPGETFTAPIPATRLGNDGLPGVESDEAAATQPEAATPPVAVVVDWTLAGQHVGKTITVEGKIVDTHNSGKVCFLNFADNRDSFYVIIFDEAMDSFPEPPRKYFLHKTIRVTGKVYIHSGRAQIRVTDAKQIEVVP